MARSVKPDEYRAKREQILDAALRMIHSRGYEQMTVQDILDDLVISKGAFYHYFGSKQAVLEALVDRMSTQAVASMLPLVQDPALSAIEKLRRYIEASTSVKTENRGAVEAVSTAWFSDHNALVRQKLVTGMTDVTSPTVIEPILRQGVEEGTFAIRHPAHAARIIMGLTLSVGDEIAQVLAGGARDDVRVRAAFEAWFEAVERIVGAAEGSLSDLTASVTAAWTDDQP